MSLSILFFSFLGSAWSNVRWTSSGNCLNYQKLIKIGEKLISTCETYVSTEAVARRCSVENVFLKFFQYSQEEKVYWSFFFNKFAGLRLESLLIKEALVQVYSCEFCKTFKTIFFHGRNIWLLSLMLTSK